METLVLYSDGTDNIIVRPVTHGRLGQLNDILGRVAPTLQIKEAVYSRDNDKPFWTGISMRSARREAAAYWTD